MRGAGYDLIDPEDHLCRLCRGQKDGLLRLERLLNPQLLHVSDTARDDINSSSAVLLVVLGPEPRD